MDHNKREKPSKPSPKNCLSYIYVDGRKISSLLTVFVNFLLIVENFQVHQILIHSCQWALFWLNYEQFESLESILKHAPCSGGDDRPNWVPCGTCSWLCPNCDSGIKQTFGQSLDQFSIQSTSFVKYFSKMVKRMYLCRTQRRRWSTSQKPDGWENYLKYNFVWEVTSPKGQTWSTSFLCFVAN